MKSVILNTLALTLLLRETGTARRGQNISSKPLTEAP